MVAKCNKDTIWNPPFRFYGKFSCHFFVFRFIQAFTRVSENIIWPVHEFMQITRLFHDFRARSVSEVIRISQNYFATKLLIQSKKKKLTLNYDPSEFN